MNGKEPPFVILYAEKDFPGCEKMSKDLCAALQKNKVEAECVEIKDRDHVSIMIRLMLSEADPAAQTLLAFTAENLHGIEPWADVRRPDSMMIRSSHHS